MEFSQQIQQFAQNHSIMVIAWVALFIAVIYSFYKSATSKFKIVDNAQATQLINKEEGLVLDLRSDDEFRSGHILDSVHILPSDVKSGKVQNIEKYKDRPVILTDNAGLTTSSNAELLVKQGFSKVYVLKEGIAGWRAANLPLVRKHK